MPNPNAIFSRTVRLDPPLDRAPSELLRSEHGLSVELDEGRRVRLDPGDERSPGYARILDGLGKLGRPVYLEVDPATSAVARLLIPHLTRVIGLHPIDGRTIGVELELSHGAHLLRRDQPDFADIEKGLRAAQQTARPVALTEDDGHLIIDVRPFEPGVGGGPPLPKPDFPPAWLPRWIGALLCWIWCWPWWPWWWFRCVSPASAQQAFDAMSATSCNPLTVPPPCIPFMYPDDGCWGRAHEMCRLMINMGLAPRKVWIRGSSFLSLVVQTRNNPQCQVRWNWHVAPTLCVRGPSWFESQTMVIDPSLFTAPVTEATWKGKQSDPAATLTASDASDFFWGSTDPTYVQTNQVLATYRLYLQNRAIQFGPPPYANCP